VIAYIVRRLAVSVLLLLVASFVCFALVQALGDPIAEWATGQRQRNPQGADAAIAGAYAKAGLDQPFLTRYVTWLGNFLTGNWGTTVNPGHSPIEVMPKILHASSITLRLILFATVLAIVVGMFTGVITAARQNSIMDYTVTGLSFLVFSMPIFSVAVLLKIAGINFNNLLQSVGLPRWLVTAGYPPGGFTGDIGHLIFQFTGVYLLPTLSLLLISFATYTRFQRASMLEVISADYVRTARAKGLPERRVLWVHAFRNALIPIVTVAALNIGSVISGAVITETVFGWQGMGALLVTYVNQKEPYMILAFLMVTAVFVIAANLLADVAYSSIDPRIRLD
jgi:ABC-type dipeptide/oligopeptide/nickel transport system permease component